MLREIGLEFLWIERALLAVELVPIDDFLRIAARSLLDPIRDLVRSPLRMRVAADEEIGPDVPGHATRVVGNLAVRKGVLLDFHTGSRRVRVCTADVEHVIGD